MSLFLSLSPVPSISFCPTQLKRKNMVAGSIYGFVVLALSYNNKRKLKRKHTHTPHTHTHIIYSLFYFNERERPEHCSASLYGRTGDWTWDPGTLGIKVFCSAIITLSPSSSVVSIKSLFTTLVPFLSSMHSLILIKSEVFVKCLIFFTAKKNHDCLSPKSIKFETKKTAGLSMLYTLLDRDIESQRGEGR